MRRYLRREAGLDHSSSTDGQGTLLNVLRQVDLFHGISRQLLVRVVELCHEETYQSGEMIVHEATQGEELYVIIQGAVEILIGPDLVSAHPQSTQPQVIATLWPGQTFGEIGLVDPGMRSASARAAVKGTRLQAINREQLLRLCDEDTEFGYRLMCNIAADLAYKIRHTDLMLRQHILWSCAPDSVESP